MGDWSYMSSLLDKVQSHSTVVGKIWMSVLFLFRIFVLGAAVDNVWGDEVSEFYCDSLEPGCKHSCYDWRFPISYVHYWVLQITFVSTPTLAYLGHAIHIIHREKRQMEKLRDIPDGAVQRRLKYTDERGKVQITGVLFCTYMTQLVFKILLEVGFCVGQFYIFGPPFMEPYFHCTRSPCASLSGAQCYVSRPREKTIFVVFMLVVSGVSVLLNILEMIYLMCGRRRNRRYEHQAQQESLLLQQQSSNTAQEAARNQYGGHQLLPPPPQGPTGPASEYKHKDSDVSKEKVP